jgi:long-subunit acyl-CoA synthetase (AMP-forming)
VEGGELTPTMKIRRFVIEEKFKEQIEAMYHEHIRAEGRLP